MTSETESTAGEWLRQLSQVVDNKDKQLLEQANVINNLTHNRLVVGWIHPQTKRFVYDDTKQQSIKSGSKKAAEYVGYTTPVFVQLEKP